MSSVLEISRFEGGWAVKLWETGEVLFFASSEEAEREARRLATRAGVAPTDGEVQIEIHDFGQELKAEWPLEAVTAASA